MGKKSTIRDTSRDYAEFVPIPEDIKKKFKHMRYDTCLHIVIYGEPFSDSRPRVNQKTMGVALINMNKFKVVFKDLYNRSELLQNLTIVSPFHMKGKFYKSPTKADLKFIKSKKVLSKLYESEKLADISIKDTDNMLKIHNDILFEPEFRITLDDAWNGGFDDSEKFLSDNERAEIWLYYSSEPNNFYKWKMEKNHNYTRWLVSEKNMKQNNRTPKEQFKHIKSVLKTELSTVKSVVDKRKIIKRILSVIEEYPAEVVKTIAEMNDYRFNKTDAQRKIIQSACLGDKTAEEIVACLSVDITDNESNDYGGNQWNQLINNIYAQ